MGDPTPSRAGRLSKSLAIFSPRPQNAAPEARLSCGARLGRKRCVCYPTRTRFPLPSLTGCWLRVIRRANESITYQSEMEGIYDM